MAMVKKSIHAPESCESWVSSSRNPHAGRGLGKESSVALGPWNESLCVLFWISFNETVAHTSSLGVMEALVQGWPNFLDSGPFSEIWTKARATLLNSIFIFFAFSLNFWVFRDKLLFCVFTVRFSSFSDFIEFSLFSVFSSVMI